MMKPIAGIDLGTTYSAIATLDALGKPHVIPNSEGERLTPSVVAFLADDPADLILTGRAAKNPRDEEPENVVTEIKRKMGEDFACGPFRGKTYRPEEISALILRKLVGDASSQVGRIDHAVITVPAYFSEPHRRATIDAGEIAGLNVKAIINEPTAAALFYATNQNVSGKVVVFDLGGGTFDVTVMDVQGRNIDIIASEGDRHLGGVDFDRALAGLFNSKHKDLSGFPAFGSETDLVKFLNDAEERKKSLSSRSQQTMTFRSEAGSTKVQVTRQEFEEAISPLVAKAEMLVEAVLDEASIEPAALSKVLLVGGSSRIPFVHKRLEAIFGFPPATEVNLDEAVACGAALHAGLLALESNEAFVPAGVRAGLTDLNVTEVANHSYGTIIVKHDAETEREALTNVVLIPRGTTLPHTETRTYYTVVDDQTSIRAQITIGDDPDPGQVNILYEEEMILPSNRPAGRPIEVSYSYDRGQCMACSFKDVESGAVFEVELSLTEGGMSASVKKQSRESLEAFQIE